jgi:hypothetical protein
MSQIAKLVQAIRNNPRDVRFDDACKVAKQLGYDGPSISGSHYAYSMPGDPEGLNFQNRNGMIPTYQARQLIHAIDKYEGNL